MTISGTVVKKEFKKNPAKAELIVSTDSGNVNIQIRPKLFYKLIEIDTGDIVKAECLNELSLQGNSNINNFLLSDIQKIV